MKLALIPLNVRVGDFEANLKSHLTEIEKAHKLGAKLVVFPELSLIGYSPQDLLLRPNFSDLCEKQLQGLELALKNFPDLAVIVGTALAHPALTAQVPTVKPLVNAAVFLHAGKREIRLKTLLPFYDVFSESRYFEASTSFAEEFRAPISYLGKKIGIVICEDSWHSQHVNGKLIHQMNPSAALAAQGVDFLINISASPFDQSKKSERRRTIAETAKKISVPTAYVNHFGAHDSIVFDGDAFVVNKSGELLANKAEFNGDPLICDWESTNSKPEIKLANAELRDLEAALVTGLRDYAKKNGFSRFVLGISGGIDSALVAALASRALGADKVIGLAMPSKFSSIHSLEDAEELAANLRIKLHHVPIKMPQSTFQMGLKPFFGSLPEDATEENLQSRLRGITVMAFSNKFQALALATGNKSEFAVGYSTLYGDMCGALAPIGDLYKTEVYALARYLNEGRKLIPERSLTKAPSAELKPNQTDQDSLPPYDLLDSILFQLIDEEKSPEPALAALLKQFPKLNLSLVEEIERKLRIAEFKRRQAPPILRMSCKAFGEGRRYPITALF